MAQILGLEGNPIWRHPGDGLPHRYVGAGPTPLHQRACHTPPSPRPLQFLESAFHRELDLACPSQASLQGPENSSVLCDPRKAAEMWGGSALL